VTTDGANASWNSTLSGILKATAGVFSGAVSGTDYAPATSGSAILKGDGAGGFSSAAAGTDYAPATSGTSILKGDGSGGTSAVVSGTDIKTINSTSLLGSGDIVIATDPPSFLLMAQGII
jgi:hypothetical protein